MAKATEKKCPWEKNECPWEKELPPNCAKCEHSRFLAGFFTELLRLRKENYSLNRVLEEIQGVSRNLSHNVRYEFEKGLRGMEKVLK